MLEGAVPWPEEFATRYRREGYWTGDVLGGMPARWAGAFGDRTAVVAGDERWTYRDLHERSERLAAGFRGLGIGPGDRVVVQLPNVPEFFEVLFALFSVGAVPVVVLPAYRRSEVTYFCTFTDAVAYVIADQHAGFDFRPQAEEVRAAAPKLRHVIVVGEPGGHTDLDELRRDAGGADRSTEHRADPQDVALLHLSGGTTGTPKLIPRTPDDYLYGARASARLCGFTPADVYLCALPVAHQFPLSAPGALGILGSGGRGVLAPNPAPDTAFPLIERAGHRRGTRTASGRTVAGRRGTGRPRPGLPEAAPGGRGETRHGTGRQGLPSPRRPGPAGVRHDGRPAQLHPSRRSGRRRLRHPGATAVGGRRDTRGRRR